MRFCPNQAYHKRRECVLLMDLGAIWSSLDLSVMISITAYWKVRVLELDTVPDSS